MSDTSPEAPEKTHGPFVRAVYAAAAAPQTITEIAEQAQSALHTARTNRGMIGDIVRLEVEKAVAALGMVTPTEVVELRKRVSDLERRVESLRKELANARSTATTSTTPSRSNAPKLGGNSGTGVARSHSAAAAPKNDQPSEALREDVVNTSSSQPLGKPAVSTPPSAAKRVSKDTTTRKATTRQSTSPRSASKRSPKPAKSAVSASSTMEPTVGKSSKTGKSAKAANASKPARTDKSKSASKDSAGKAAAQSAATKKASPAQSAIRKRLEQPSSTAEADV